MPPRRKTSLIRLLWLAMIASPLPGLLSPGLARAADPAALFAAITPTPAQTLRGWGMSLAWVANRLYGSPLMPAEIKEKAEQSRYMDLLFGDPAREPGLGLNVARYNIGGGENPDRTRCVRPPSQGLWPQAQMEGFLTGPDGRYDWSRDASQRRMLHEAKARGADLFEAFSNSPPWWMTVSLCVSGAEHSAEDNLRADAVPAFAAYLATVAEHFRHAEGIPFTSVSPVNEPDGLWWVLGNHQEGSFASLGMQQAVVTALARRLAGTGMIVAGTEANNLDTMTRYLADMDAGTLAALGRVNVHQYNGTDPGALHRRVVALGKPLWASEMGCCFTNDQPEMAGALTMAASIQSALHDLGAEVWCLWQPDWGVIGFNGGQPRPLKQFYAIAQYTRFIRPGFSVLASQGSNTLAALSPDRRRLVLVAINPGNGTVPADFDLTALHRPGAAVAIYRTTAEPGVNLVRVASQVGTAGHLVDRQPPSSVTTYVIDGAPLAVRSDRRAP